MADGHKAAKRARPVKPVPAVAGATAQPFVRPPRAPYATDPRVIAVEVKNEFQPNDTAAVTWVRQVIPAIRAAAPAMPLTLSVDGATGAAGMAKIKSSLVSTPLDYYDFHFYGNSERSLAEIRKALQPGPVLRMEVVGDPAAALAALKGMPDVGEPKLEGGAILVPFAAPRERIPDFLRAALDRGVAVAGLAELKTDLEDLFMKLTQGDVA